MGKVDFLEVTLFLIFMPGVESQNSKVPKKASFLALWAKAFFVQPLLDFCHTFFFLISLSFYGLSYVNPVVYYCQEQLDS